MTSFRWGAVLAILAATTALSAPREPMTAVIAEGDTELIHLAQGLADVIQSRLAKNGVPILSRSELDPLLAELSLRRKMGLSTTDDPLKIEGASYFVIVTLTRTESKELLVGARLLRSAGGEVLGSWIGRYSEGELLSGAENIGGKAAASLKHVSTRAAPSMSVIDPTAETLLLQGLAEYHEGRIEESIRDFWASLQKQPNSPHARRWLAIAYRASGDTDLAEALNTSGTTPSSRP